MKTISKAGMLCQKMCIFRKEKSCMDFSPSTLMGRNTKLENTPSAGCYVFCCLQPKAVLSRHQNYEEHKFFPFASSSVSKKSLESISRLGGCSWLCRPRGGKRRSTTFLCAYLSAGVATPRARALVVWELLLGRAG